jgi:hypothetical protein
MYLKPLFQHNHYPDHLAEIGRVFLSVLLSDIMDVRRLQISAILKFLQGLIDEFPERDVR